MTLDVDQEYDMIQNALGDKMSSLEGAGKFAEAREVGKLMDRMIECRDKFLWLLEATPERPFGRRGYWARHATSRQRLADKEVKLAIRNAKRKPAAVWVVDRYGTCRCR